MQGMRTRSTTPARGRYGSFSELLWRGVKRGFHSGACFGSLHPRQQRIEFAVQSVESGFRGARERAVFIHRKQDRLGGLVLGDEHHATLDDAVEDFPEAVLGLGCADLHWLLAPAIADRRDWTSP